VPRFLVPAKKYGFRPAFTGFELESAEGAVDLAASRLADSSGFFP
jgi:hypothetical protein